MRAMAGDAADQSHRFFVAVHVGAVYNSPSNEKALRSAMKRACLAASSLLSKVSFISPFFFWHFTSDFKALVENKLRKFGVNFNL